MLGYGCLLLCEALSATALEERDNLLQAEGDHQAEGERDDVHEQGCFWHWRQSILRAAGNEEQRQQPTQIPSGNAEHLVWRDERGVVC